MRTTRILTVYERPGCHLCDDMVVSLAEWRAELDFEIERVDVDRSPELADRYGAKVPVLVLGSVEICHYFLDLHALRRSLGARMSGPSRTRKDPHEPTGPGEDAGSLRGAGRYRRIYAIVREIPRGRVATYGQVAAIEGSCTPRMVGYALAALPASGRARRAVAACPESHRDRQRAERWRWDHHPAPGAPSRRRTLRCRWEGRLRRRRLGRTRHRLESTETGFIPRRDPAPPAHRAAHDQGGCDGSVAPGRLAPGRGAVHVSSVGGYASLQLRHDGNHLHHVRSRRHALGIRAGARERREEALRVDRAHLSRHSRHPLLRRPARPPANALCFDSRDSP